MSRPSEILREEHDVITHLLHVLDGIGAAVRQGERVPRPDIDLALEVVVNFADQCHHAKEEKALFPRLVTASPREGALLVRRLEGDHVAFRKLVGSLKELASSLESQESRAQFAKLAGTYVGLLEEHIRQENDLLLPMVDRVLPAPTREALVDAFDRIEREEVGSGLHERYEHAIHELAAKYVHGEAAARGEV